MSPDQEAGDDWEHGTGDQLEHAVEPDAHLVQNVVISRQLELKFYKNIVDVS